MLKEVEIPSQPGDNFAVCRLSAWTPDNNPPRGVVVITPGSNDDGRGWIKYNKDWMAFAAKHRMALVGVQLVDREPSWVEQYIDVKAGSGAAFLTALNQLGLAELPLYLWGFSAGGEFNYELACWLAPKEPHRIKAFIVNKGGVYMSLLAPPEARQIPAIFFIGEHDNQWRKDTVHAIYILNTVAGSRWTEVVERTGHTIHSSEKLSMKLFADVLRTQ